MYVFILILPPTIATPVSRQHDLSRQVLPGALSLYRQRGAPEYNSSISSASSSSSSAAVTEHFDQQEALLRQELPLTGQPTFTDHLPLQPSKIVPLSCYVAEYLWIFLNYVEVWIKTSCMLCHVPIGKTHFIFIWQIGWITDNIVTIHVPLEWC